MRLALAAALLLLGGSVSGAENAVPARRPNIVFIELDDLTYTYAGAFGCRTAITPNIDRLAREGVVFDQAMCQGMMCGPSRNCLITGTYPHQLGFYRNGQMKSLRPHAWTFSAALRRAGYFTAWIGKSHLRPYQPPGGSGDVFNAALGFDHSLHTLGRAMLRGKAGSRPNPYRKHLQQRGLWETYLADIRLKRNSTLPEDDYLDGWFARLTVDFLHDYANEKPLFLWVNFSLPHGPYDVPDAYHAPFADKPMPGESKPVNYTAPPSLVKDTRLARNLAQVIEHQRGFHAAIYFVDRQVGRILQALEARGLLDQTWIVFFSDHGIMQGAHGRFHKGTLFRQVTQPSLIIRGPAGTPRGRRCDQPVELTDLLPTFLAVAGARETAPAGISLLPVFHGKPLGRRYAFGEIEGWVAVSDGHYRLIRSVDGTQALLFDERADPENLVNLAATHPDHVRRLSAAIDDWFRQTGAPKPPHSQ